MCLLYTISSVELLSATSDPDFVEIVKWVYIWNKIFTLKNPTKRLWRWELDLNPRRPYGGHGDLQGVGNGHNMHFKGNFWICQK